MRCYEICLLAPTYNSHQVMEDAFNRSLEPYNGTFNLRKAYFSEVSKHFIKKNKNNPYYDMPDNRRIYVAHFCSDGPTYEIVESLKRSLRSYKPHCEKLPKKEKLLLKN